MKNSFFLLSLFLLLGACVADATEGKLYHQVDLHDDLWKDDPAAMEQVYMIDTDTITTLLCEKGTKLIIPTRAFVAEEAPELPVEAKVELRLIEVYQSAEMFRYHLNTQEESGKLLESAGMVYLEAYSEGKRLQLKEGKKILLGFPKKEGFENAFLFTNTESADGSMRWQKEESSFELRQAILDTYFEEAQRVEVQISLAEEEGSRNNKQAAGSAHAQHEYTDSAWVLLEDENITDSISLLQDYHAYDFFASPTLDWINCDRFVKDEFRDVRFNIAGFPANTLYYLLFEDINSLMAGYCKEGETADNNPVFGQLPQGRKASLVAVYNKEGLYYLAQEEIVIASEHTIELKPEKTEKREIVNYLKSLGRQEFTALR